MNFGKQLIVVIGACLMTPLFLAGQQIPQYSQYLLNGLFVNPAFAGYRDRVSAQLFYHNQWVGPGTPQYLAFVMDGKVKNGVNLGLIYSNERMGSVAINSFSFAYAFRVRTSQKSDLSIGLSAGSMYYGVDYSDLAPIEQNDPLIANLANQWVPTIDVGVYFGSDVVSAGLSARNITNSKQFGTHETGDFLIPITGWQSILTFGVALPLSKQWEFRPSFMWQEDFRNPSRMDFTAAMLFIDRVWAGLSFRTDQHFWKPEVQANINNLYSMAIVAEGFITDRITLSYAYDFGLNTNSSHYFGGHEISIGFYFSRKTDSRFNRKYRYKKYRVDDVCEYCP